MSHYMHTIGRADFFQYNLSSCVFDGHGGGGTVV